MQKIRKMKLKYKGEINMRNDLSKIIKKKYDELDEKLVYCEDEDIRPIVYTQKILNDILEELS